VSVLQRPGVGALQLGDHLRHPVGPEEGRALGALDLADLLGHAGALVHQLQQLAVQRVDLHPQRGQRV